ncbi:MAG: adenylate/guanylate cyclase domain-containing protein [Spirochaetaceae bacterium]|nr:MAG: adenylate/guanylate cyclase domain-containing protein [Spirochaetaceae bacterium]
MEGVTTSGTRPSGTVTFLFTDIEGSTNLWDTAPDLMRPALERHDAIVAAAVAAHDGHVFKTVGDAFCVVFHRANDAVRASVAIERAIAAEPWDLPRPMRVRIGIHSGEAYERAGDYFGPVVNRVARIEAAAHGGQILASLVTQELVRDLQPEGIGFHELGAHRLKDLVRPESLFQIVADGLDTEFPPLRTLDRYHHNLPVETTPFLGRETELHRLRELVLDGQYPIVSIVGPGGMGKTRIARQIAADVIDRFADGSFFVDLAAVRDRDLVYPAIAAVFGFEPSAPATIRDAVIDGLRPKQLLLVLDNCEQVAGAADVATEIATTCPDVRCLITSRIPLHVRGEVIVDLPALSLPDPNRTADDAQSLSQYESVWLFVERATAVRGDFTVTNRNAPAVAQICQRLDGIPLAIELAATRIRSMSPESLLSRLDQRLRVLTGGAVDLPERQRTLRATIEWSYELLDGAQQASLAALAVFSGFIRLPAAEAVLGCALMGSDSSDDPIDLVEALVERSLLCVTPLDEADPAYCMLETIHEYATERLEALPRRDGIRTAFAAYYADLALRIDAALGGPDQAEWLRHAWSELENMEAALPLALDPVTRARIALACAEVYEIKGAASRAVAAARLGLDADPVGLIAARLHLVIGRAGLASADVATAQHHLGRAVDLAAAAASEGCDERARETELLARCERAHLQLVGGLNEALGYRPQDVAADARRLGVATAEARAEFVSGNLALAGSDLDAARLHYGSASAIYEGIGDARRAAQCRVNLGIVAYASGHHSEARVHFTAAIMELASIGDQSILATAYSNLGNLLVAEGDLCDARNVFESLIGLADRLDMYPMAAAGHAGLSDVYRLRGKTSEALSEAQTALSLIRRAGGGCDESLHAGLAHRVHGDILVEMLRERPDDDDLRMRASAAYEAAGRIFREYGEHEEYERTRSGLERLHHVIGEVG